MQEPDGYLRSNKARLNEKPMCTMLQERYMGPPNLVIDAEVKRYARCRGAWSVVLDIDWTEVYPGRSLASKVFGYLPPSLVWPTAPHVAQSDIHICRSLAVPREVRHEVEGKRLANGFLVVKALDQPPTPATGLHPRSSLAHVGSCEIRSIS
jgi:hypothetical protein